MGKVLTLRTSIPKSVMNLTYNEPKSRDRYLPEKNISPDFPVPKGSIYFLLSNKCIRVLCLTLQTIDRRHSPFDEKTFLCYNTRINKRRYSK